MSASGEVESVRRAITLFVLLVVVPVVGLVGFGVLAISHERAAVEKRFADEYLPRLRGVAEELGTRIAAEAAGIDGRERPPGPLTRFRFELRDGALVPSPELTNGTAEAVIAAVRAADLPPGDVATLIQLGRGTGRGVYAVRRTVENGVTRDRGLALSTTALASTVEEIARERFPGDPARINLVPPADPLAAGPAPTGVYRLLDEVTAERGPTTLASLPLPDPLSDWRLVATPGDDDPIQEALVRNRTAYIVLLSLFYVAITIGIVITMRSIFRQATINRLRTDFVSNISHELRTPLTSIRMFAETLLQGRARTEEERAEALDFIARESARLGVLTERALDWARIEAGRRRFVLETVAAPAFVAEAVATFRSMRPLAAGVLEVSEDPSLPPIAVDRPALTQVLLNLLENAVKYSGDEKRIRVRLRRQRRGVAIDVEDNGVGIAKQDQKLVFERFYRADDLLARTTEGTGLGLSIAQRIVQAHGGRITLRSEPGRGSTFTVELPTASHRTTASRPKEGRA